MAVLTGVFDDKNKARKNQTDMDTTAKKGVIHDATASRYKSRLALAHDRLVASRSAS